MHKGVSNEHILVNQSVINPYYECNWKVKNLICKNVLHEHVWV